MNELKRYADLWLDPMEPSEEELMCLIEEIEAGPVMEPMPLFMERVWTEIETTEERTVISRERKSEHTPKLMRSYPFKVTLAACVTMVLMNLGAFEWAGRETGNLFQMWSDIVEGVMKL